MTEEAGRGADAREDTQTTTAETDAATGAEGQVAQAGLGEVTLARPGPGEVVPVQAEAGQRLFVAFDPDLAQIQIVGDDLVLVFPDDGRIEIQGLGAFVDDPEGPVVEIADAVVPGGTLFAQAEALAAPGAGPVTFEAAAAAAVQGTGETRYSDDTGEVIALLDPQGVIPPVELLFGLPEFERIKKFGEDDDQPVIVSVDPVGLDEDDLEGGEGQISLFEGSPDQEPGSDTLELGPFLGSPPFDPLGSQPTTISGNIVVDFGDDGPGTIALTTDGLAALGLTSSTDDEPLQYSVSADGLTLTAFTSGGTVFTLAVEPASSPGLFTYTFTLLGSINHPEGQGENPFTVPIPFVVTDTDGDTATGEIPATIVDDVPAISFDAAEGGTSTAYSIDDDFTPDLWQFSLNPSFKFLDFQQNIDGGEGADYEGLTFGASGGALFGYEDSDDEDGDRIHKIDPRTGTILATWTSEEELSDVGLTANSDGVFFVIGEDDRLFRVEFSDQIGGTFSLFEITDATTDDNLGGFELTGLAADPDDPLVLYALGINEETGVTKLFKITLEVDTDAESGFALAPDGVQELPGTISFGSNSNDDQHGLAFAPDGTLWGLVESDVTVADGWSLAFQINKETGESIDSTAVQIDGGVTDLESLAIGQNPASHLRIWESDVDLNDPCDDRCQEDFYDNGYYGYNGFSDGYLNGGAAFASTSALVVFGADGAETIVDLSQLEPSDVANTSSIQGPIKLTLSGISELDETGLLAEGGDETVSTTDATTGAVATGLTSGGHEVFVERPLIESGPNAGQPDPTKIVGFLDHDESGSFTEGDTLVFEASVDLDDFSGPVDFAHFRFEQLAPIDHSDNDDPETAEANESQYKVDSGTIFGGDLDQIRFDFGVTVMDDDGDPATAPVSVTVDDDGPQVCDPQTALVDEDGLPERDPGNNAGITDATQPGDEPDPQPFDDGNEATFSGFLNVDFGADGPGDIDFAALDGEPVVDANGDPVLSRDAELFYQWDGDTHTLTAVADRGGGEGEGGTGGAIFITGHDSDEHENYDYDSAGLDYLVFGGAADESARAGNTVALLHNGPDLDGDTDAPEYIEEMQAEKGWDVSFFDLSDPNWTNVFSGAFDVIMVASIEDFAGDDPSPDELALAQASRDALFDAQDQFAAYVNSGGGLFIHTDGGFGQSWYDFVPQFGTTTNNTIDDAGIFTPTVAGESIGFTEEIVDRDVTHSFYTGVDTGFFTVFELTAENNLGVPVDLPVAFGARGIGIEDGEFVRGAPVFELQVTDVATGAYTFNLLDQVDHPIPGPDAPGPAFEDNIHLALEFRVTDNDGDTTTGILPVDIDDDSPAQISESLETEAVEEEQNPVPGGNEDTTADPDLDDDTSIPSRDGPPEENFDITTNVSTGSLASVVAFGADGPGGFSLSTDTSGLPQNLTSKGQPISYGFADDGALVGFTGASFDPTGQDQSNWVFTLALSGESNASYAFTLLKQLDHHPVELADDVEGVLFLDFSSVVAATDFDGDSITLAPETFVIPVIDDVPVIADGEAEVVHDETPGVDEDADDTADPLPAALAARLAALGLTPIGAAKSAADELDFSFGADGPADIGPVKLTDAGGNPLYGIDSGLVRASDDAPIFLFTDTADPRLVLGRAPHSFETGDVDGDATQETITFGRPHGLSPGQPVVYNFIGNGIGGLTNGGMFFVIVVDDVTIKLAATEQDALDGNAIDLTPPPIDADALHFLDLFDDPDNIVFTAFVDDAESSLWVAQFDGVEHAVASDPDEAGGPARIDDRIFLTVTDFDGDSTTAETPLVVAFQDDGPAVGDVMMINDETPGVGDDTPSDDVEFDLDGTTTPSDPSDDVPSEITDVAVGLTPINVSTKAVPFDYGADGPGGIALDEVTDGSQSGLFDTQSGEEILLFNGNNGTVVGRVGAADGPIAFVAVLEETGTPTGPDNASSADLWFVQYRAIEHDNPFDPDEAGPETDVGADGPVTVESLGPTPDLDIVAQGLTMATGGTGLEETGSGTISVDIGGSVVSATLYWTGRDRPCDPDGGVCAVPAPPDGADDELLFDGTPIVADRVTGSEINDVEVGQITNNNIGYAADVTNIVAAAGQGTVSFEVADNDAEDMFRLNGAGLLVTYIDPADTAFYRVIAFDGLDYASIFNTPPHALVTEPVTFSYDAQDVARNAEIALFVGDALSERTDRIEIDGTSIHNALDGDEGLAFDADVFDIGISAGSAETTVQLFSEERTSDSMLWQLAALRLPVAGAARDEFVELAYTVTDADGDTAHGTATVTIEDDGPDAVDDPAVYLDGGEGASGDVVANDDFGADGPAADGAVRSFSYTGDDGAGNPATLTAPIGSTVTTFAGGELTVESDGSWTYDAPAEVGEATLVALGLDAYSAGFVDDFTYVIQDGDGDRDAAVQPIRVVLNPEAAQFGIAGSDAPPLSGTEASDFISGGINGDDLITGGGGGDLLFGDDEDLVSAFGDSLFGGEGNDLLFGDAGNDTLFGGPGDDRLAGGEDGDGFVFSLAADEGDDTISDFSGSPGGDGDVLVFTDVLDLDSDSDIDINDAVSSFSKSGSIATVDLHSGTTIAITDFDNVLNSLSDLDNNSVINPMA